MVVLKANLAPCSPAWSPSPRAGSRGAPARPRLRPLATLHGESWLVYCGERLLNKNFVEPLRPCGNRYEVSLTLQPRMVLHPNSHKWWLWSMSPEFDAD
jgi:hypothetical protein